MTDDERRSPGRRTVLCGAAASAAGLTLSGCGGSGAPAAPPPATPTAPVELGSADDVPVGGAHAFAARSIVVSQPEPGRFKAFSAVCTHKGCVMAAVRKLTIHCACHGSSFDTTTGEVLGGPAREPLPEVPVRVEGNGLIAG
ncbi:Rieske (2Fe-2S) protein [Streptomyces sp. JJ38]|uniref:Rieske (2Fe-2S) protein n=1 Tax=Streptomyces sp. JJ38 TaxID=2738128 RepID=UPI001C56F53E|nr:Rieske (2Fe-2S) protein [Streptomyces sp. JJ38]MBW1597648.1 Rieske (2Fe-2S) protein [Streptomyces sp. JJ38]